MNHSKAKFDKYDLTFSKFIRLRDKVCQKCGKGRRIECSHIHSRRHKGTRCDPSNAKGLCNNCHRWWHSEPLKSSEWLKGLIGEPAYDRLLLKANKVTKLTSWEKDHIRAEQQAEIKLMEKGESKLQPFNLQYRGTKIS